jgi:hypothetical protein
MSATIATYLSLIIVGLRWDTLPSDVAFVQDVVRLGGSFVSSLLSRFCKARSTHSAQYPRPPRTPVLEVVREEPCESSEILDTSEGVSGDEDDDEDDKNETEDSHVMDEDAESEQAKTDALEDQHVDRHNDTSDHENNSESDNDIAHSR